MLQDEIEVDKLLVVSLWRTRDDAARYHAGSFEKIKSAVEPYLTFPVKLRTYKVEDGFSWAPAGGGVLPDALREAKDQPIKSNVWHWPAS